MKYVKMLGLAAIAAAALMAFVGASTASATVLCTVQGTGSPTGTTCPAGSGLGVGAKIHAELSTGAHATLTTHEEFKPDITCETSTVEGVVTVEGDATTTTSGDITKLTFENCGPSTVTVLKPGKLEIHWISGTHNGTLTGTEQEVTTVTPSIFGSIHCIYTTNATDLGTLTGGSPAVLTANSQALNKLTTSSLCPSAPTWDASYKVTNHTSLFVAGHT